jgi:opacity protein-like surface antigen
MRLAPGIIALLVCCSFAFGQNFEVAVSGGQSIFSGATKNLGTISTNPTDAQYEMRDGFRLAVRMAINPYRFFGYEFGYAYNRTSIGVPASTGTTIGLPGQTTAATPAQTISVPIQQGFGNFLVYATPEGSHVRPFAAGGVGFSSFFPPGASASYGNQTTKFGINYGGGVKARLTSMWGIRFDVRYYNTSKPFDFPNQRGRLNMLEISGGFSFNL